jgi:hypothetical protein
MLTANLLSPSSADPVATAAFSRGHFVASREVLAAIARRPAGHSGNHGLDAKGVIARAMEIDAAEPGSPLSEGQWDFGLDMLARADTPMEASGLAARQARIVAALSKALAELSAEARATAS